MNALIIFVLLFTFPLKAKSDSNNTENSNNSSSNSTIITSPVVSETSQPINGCHLTLICCNHSINSTKDILDLRMALTFFMGMICSTLIFSSVLFFVIICNRCRTTDANTDKENIILEDVKSEHDQSMMKSDADQADEQTPLHVQAPAEVSTNIPSIYSGTEKDMKILGKEQAEGAEEAAEVNYASINYSLLLKNDGYLQPQKTESDYAEIQLKIQSEGEEVDILQEGEKMDGVKEHEVKQDGVDQGLGELEEVQV